MQSLQLSLIVKKRAGYVAKINSKSEYRNPKQIRISNDRNPKPIFEN